MNTATPNFCTLVDSQRRPLASFQIPRPFEKGETIIVDGEAFIIDDIEESPGGMEVDGKLCLTSDFRCKASKAVSGVDTTLQVKVHVRGEGKVVGRVFFGTRQIGVYDLSREPQRGDRFQVDNGQWVSIVELEQEITWCTMTMSLYKIRIQGSEPPKPPLEFHTKQPQAAA